MRYRKLDESGDMQFGGSSGFLKDSPEAVAQAISTRLKLWLGEWFLDLSAGTPYKLKVLGKYTGATKDVALRSQIIATQGVKRLINYSSSLNRSTRSLSVSATVETDYGQITIKETL